jgi:DNA-binding CsgD family transcriptional regulator
MDTRTAERARREIIRLCHAGLDSRELRAGVLAQLRRAIPIDAFWAATVDPATLLFTGSVIEGIPEHATPAFLANEFLHDDVNKFVALARGAPVNSLAQATRGDMEGSERYREILAPLGMGDELRAALLSDGACWGVLCLHRQREDPAFAAAEIALLQQLTAHLAEGLRAALLLDEATTIHAADGPGLLLVSDDFSVIATTPAAEGWLAEMGDWPRRDEVPQAVRAVAARLWELEQTGTPGAALTPRVRVRTRAGRWLVLHAARLSGVGTGGTTAVMLEQAPPLEVAPLVLQAYALTEREARVAQLVLQGLSTNEIAARLFISALTVQDHLKAIFTKTGVNSRRALVAQIFAQQYLPHMGGGTTHGDGQARSR